jgi:AraC family transcriptional regulator
MFFRATETATLPAGPHPMPARVNKVVWPECAPEGLPLEPVWRRVPEIDSGSRSGAAVLASRWTDEASHPRRAEAQAPADRHVLGIALRRTRIRLTRGPHEIFDGFMAAGTVHVSRPSQRLEAEFRAPCDFVHLYVADGCAGRLGSLAARDRRAGPCDLSGVVLRDPLAAQLAMTLTDGRHARDPLYLESIARTLLLRLAALSVPRTGVCALPRWRLKKVQDHVQAHLASPISLADLAGVAGLSRSYFAAQFRAATGCRPHEYVLEQRVEQAQAMLAESGTPIIEVALAVGFQTQAHFSTVFKRLTGTTPARWRLTQLDRTRARCSDAA